MDLIATDPTVDPTEVELTVAVLKDPGLGVKWDVSVSKRDAEALTRRREAQQRLRQRSTAGAEKLVT